MKFPSFLGIVLACAFPLAYWLQLKFPPYKYPPAGPTETQLLEQSLVRRLTPDEFLRLSTAGRDYVRQYGTEL